MEKQLDELREKIENIESHLQVELVNGKRTVKFVNEAVQEIWTDIEIIRDANKIHRINKKYKIYWFVAAVVTLVVGSDLKDVIAEALKTILK